jgi:hypothetical protein
MLSIHAGEKAVIFSRGAMATDVALPVSGKPRIIANFLNLGNVLGLFVPASHEPRLPRAAFVDKVLIN